MSENVSGEVADLSKGNEILFSLYAASKEEVNDWAKAAEKAGAMIFKSPQPYEEGYLCGFADPDGHKFNVLYWPGMM